jgi:excisionase family DNA binding protein
MIERSDLLTAEETAQYLGVRVITVYEWCRQGRLPCLKLGKVWRIRRSALDEFLERSERRMTLVGQLRAFLMVPDSVLAVAETSDLLYHLNAAFFQVGEARDGVLVKYYGEHSDPVEVIRENLMRHAPELNRLEAVGRLQFTPEMATTRGRVAAVRQLIEREVAPGQSVWVSFDWQNDVDLATALQQQEALAAVVRSGRVVVKTDLLAAAVDEWPSAMQRRARQLHGGIIELSESGLVLSRRMPPPTS